MLLSNMRRSLRNKDQSRPSKTHENDIPSSQTLENSKMSKPIKAAPKNAQDADFANTTSSSRRSSASKPGESIPAKHARSELPQSTACTPLGPKPVERSSQATDIHMSQYGDRHARREHERMLEHVQQLRKAGNTPEYILEQMSKPWQAKGELVINYKHEDLARWAEESGIVQADMVILGPKASRVRWRKKDDEEKRFLERYFNGEIDEYGKEIAGGILERSGSQSTGSCCTQEAVDGDVFTPSSECYPSSSSSGQSNQAALSKRKSIPIVSPASSHSSHISAYPETRSASHAGTAGRSSKPSPQAKTPQPKNPITPIDPLPGYPNYQAYDYYQLAALCSDRNLPSGQCTQALRNRLIQDDFNIVNNLPRVFRSYGARTNRPRISEAPVVPNMSVLGPVAVVGKGKRGCEGGSDEAEGQRKRMKRG